MKVSSLVTPNLFSSVNSNYFQSMIASVFSLKLCKKKRDNKNLYIPCCAVVYINIYAYVYIYIYIYIYICIYIYIYVYIYYESYFQQVKLLRVDSCTYLHGEIFWSACIYFSCVTLSGEQVETWEKFFTELPLLLDQPISHLHSSNLNHLERLFIRLDDSPNVLNIFPGRWGQPNIPETLKKILGGFWKNFILSTHASLILL